MSTLNEDDIKNLAALCRLNVTEDEVHQLQHDLKRILDYVEQLDEVDVKDLSPYAHMEAQTFGALRDDLPDNQLAREVFLDNTPDQVGGMVRVPPVISKDV